MAKGQVSLVSPEGARQVLGLRGLPRAQELIGAKFLYGDEEHFIGGSVTSIGYGQQEGVKLYITSTRFRGKSVLYLKEKGDGWVAVASDSEEVPGTLYIF